MLAYFQLNIASDRIRDYFVYALTGNNFKTYVGDDEKKKEYSRFFSDALKITPNQEASSLAEVAKSLASDVQKCRKVRNQMVHNLASQNAKLQKGFFKNLKNNKSSIFHNIASFTDEIQDNVDWYKKLVELGNLVFLIESKTRK